MQKLTLARWFIIATITILAACSGSPPTNDILPTRAQLPTTTPGLSIPPTASPNTPILTLDIETTAEILESPATSTSLPIPPADQPIVFPTLVVGMHLTLQGHLTVTKDQQRLLTDDVGQSIVVIMDDFAAQTANGKVVQISGTVKEQAGIMVVQIIGIAIIDETPPAPINTFPTPATPTLPPFLVTPTN